jgi:hypothetical protein
MRVRFVLAFVLTALAALASYAQQGGWTREEESDPLHNSDYTQFTLEGKYLVPPRHRSADAPLLILQCQEGAHSRAGSQVNGKLLAGYLDVDATLDFREDSIPVQYRLDDGKLQEADWSTSTDGGGASFGEKELEKLLYGRSSPRKEDANPPVRKIVVGIPERLGTQIEAQFNMPDPSEVAQACGVIVHKK